ncbi:pyrroline-5-carboxylate reductase [Moraxella marmotae]|uniref:pyrroline-5-carboxylate reductase n=1 Tax=Moraxella marmotae TaxID=3344520 RepID=UPI0035F31372
MTDFSVLNGKTVAFIGGGNMAGAIIDGLLKAKHEHQLDLNLSVSDSDADKQTAFTNKGVTAVSPEAADGIIKAADVVVLAVKPQIMREVAASIAPHLDRQLVLSIAAGLSVATLSQMLGGYRHIVRCMPNLPASKGFGASGLFADGIAQADCQLAEAVMQASGIVSWVKDEALLHAVTAVAGSAPAYFFYVLENMIAKAVQMGLEPADAHALAVQSLRGAGVLAVDNDPATLREQVTSKGGTTAAALDSLYADEVGQAFAKAMQACSDRSVELGQVLSQ